MPDQLKAQIAATDKQISSFARSLANFLELNIHRIVTKLQAGNGAQAARVLLALEQEIHAAGLDSILADLHPIYINELTYIRKEFAKLGKDTAFSSADKDTLEALITFDTSHVLGTVQAYFNDSRSTIMRSIIAGERPDLTTLTETLTPRLQANLNTEITTAVSAFSRVVTLKKSQDLGFTKFKYLGPDDGVTRPFCQARVGKIFTQQEIDSWPDQQGLPANIYLGGYNCRHQLRPVE